MKIVYMTSLILFSVSLALIGLSLVDIVDFGATVQGVVEVVAVVSLSVFVKTSIRLYKSTRRF